MGWKKMEYVKCLVYDLGSENRTVFSDEEIKNKVRSARVSCVELLHSLGVQCTESVILIAPHKAQYVDRYIAKVQEIYEQLNEVLRSHNFTIQLRPIIEVLELTTDQANRLIPLAQRRLISSLDRAIDTVSEIIDLLNTTIEEERRRRIRMNLRRMGNEWRRIYEMAQSLGINITEDYSILIELIDEALERCQ
jgi:flagellin-specific chaperone FliS